MLVFIPQSRGTHQYLEGEVQVQVSSTEYLIIRRTNICSSTSHHPNRLVEDIGSNPSSQIWKIPAIFFVFLLSSVQVDQLLQ